MFYIHIALCLLDDARAHASVLRSPLQPRQYAAYTPSVGLAQRKVMQGDITKMEMQLAAKEVSLSKREA